MDSESASLDQVAASMKLGAFVITFNRPRILQQTLQSLLQQSPVPDRILVVDNGNSAKTKDALKVFDSSRVVYHALPENRGPAGASAYALQRLSEEGYDWIYWGDEDDPPEFPDIFERIMKIAQTATSDIAAIGAVGTRFDWSNGETSRLPDEALKGLVDVDVIGGNSQFFLRKEAITAVGVPDSRLFFGHYEPEYCLRLRRAGFRLVVDGDLMWKHREKLGRLQLKIEKALVSDYPYGMIWRRYYRTRNYIFMMRRTFGRPDLARRELWKALARSMFCWRRGPVYGAAFARLQLRGIFDGYRGCMGQTVAPRPK